MNRVRQIAGGVAWAFRFGNPLEILAARHLFRRKRAVVVQHGAMQMLIDSEGSDAAVVSEVFLRGMYDAAIREAGDGRDSVRYLNLGANIGAFDVRLFQLLQPACRRIAGLAVEMNPAAHARLIVNLELNRLTTVRALNAAAWDSAGLTQVRIEERDTGQRCEASAPREGWPVPLLPWSALLAQASGPEPLDLLKIDIEGAEEKVVPQMTARDRERLRFLVIETHGLAVHELVGRHLTGIGFIRRQEQPGDGATHLALWEGAG